MKTLIAKKIGMTQIYDENSKSLGVTVLDVSDCRVVQVKNNETDGYSAVQLTIGKKKNLSKKGMKIFIPGGMEMNDDKYKNIKTSNLSNNFLKNFYFDGFL